MEQTPEIRVAAMVRAIELGVDIDDFRFIDPSENDVYLGLLAEHECRIDKDDSVWAAA